MKIVFTTAILLLGIWSAITNANIDPQVDLIGKWENKAIDAEYQFKADGSAKFFQGFAGGAYTYVLDTTQSPMWLDMTMSRGRISIEIPCLLKFVHKDTVWIQQFSPSSAHPVAFSEDQSKIHILSRVK